MIITVVLLLTLLSDSIPFELRHSFDEMELGRAPVEFSFAHDGPAGDWKIISDGTNKVLAQRDKTEDRHRTALALIDVDLKSVKIEVRIKCVSGEKDRTGGVVWRYRDANNYLLARVDVEDDRVRLYRVVNGNRIRFGKEDDVNLRTNRWYTLRIEHDDQTVKVYLDGEVLIVERDQHFPLPGKLGLWTKADAVTYFDDIRFGNCRRIRD